MTALACPECQHTFNTPMSLGERLIKIVPSSGEMTVCLNCSSVLAFDGQPLSVRLADVEDLATLDEEELDNLYLCRLTVQAYRQQHS